MPVGAIVDPVTAEAQASRAPTYRRQRKYLYPSLRNFFFGELRLADISGAQSRHRNDVLVNQATS